MAIKHSACETGYTVTITKGYKFELPWEYTNPDGTGIDLTGKAVVFQLIFDDVTYTFTDTPNAYGSVVLVTDAVNGEFTVSIDKDETATFDVATGKWALVIDDVLIYADTAEVVEL